MQRTKNSQTHLYSFLQLFLTTISRTFGTMTTTFLNDDGESEHLIESLPPLLLWPRIECKTTIVLPIMIRFDWSDWSISFGKMLVNLYLLRSLPHPMYLYPFRTRQYWKKQPFVDFIVLKCEMWSSLKIYRILDHSRI